MYNPLIADYYQLVTLKIPGVAGTGNTQVEFSFEDQPDMRYARLISIIAFAQEDLQTAYPIGLPVIPANQLNKISLVLETNDPDDLQKKKGKNGQFTTTLQTVRQIPLTALRVNQSFGLAPGSFVRMPLLWHDRYCVWQKSGIKIAAGGIGNTTDICIALGVFYTFLNWKGEEISPRN